MNKKERRATTRTDRIARSRAAEKARLAIVAEEKSRREAEKKEHCLRETREEISRLAVCHNDSEAAS